MTPNEYKALYTNLKVKRRNGTIEPVTINRYVLNNSSWFNPGALETFRRSFFSRRIDTDLTIFTNNGEVNVQLALTKAEQAWQKKGVPMRFEIDNKKGGTAVSTNDVDWGGLCVYCFLGKGAPEHYQIVLQLADHWGLAPSGLQAYADSALGLDCNGFVGNYLWHGKKGKPWHNGGYHQEMGPDTLITSFFKGGPFLSRWEDIDPSKMYLFGMVNAAGQIIPGGNGVATAGHIMITQPGKSGRGTWDTISPMVWVVESTAGAIRPGLTEGWYECLEYDKKGVFTLHRGKEMQEAHNEIKVKVMALS